MEWILRKNFVKLPPQLSLQPFLKLFNAIFVVQMRKIRSFVNKIDVCYDLFWISAKVYLRSFFVDLSRNLFSARGFYLHLVSQFEFESELQSVKKL